MATLEKIRSKSVLLLVVVGVALFAFIATDFINSGSTFSQQKQENIIVVNGEGVHYHDFMARVDGQLNAYKRMGQTLTDDETHQVRQMVLNDLINEMLLEKEIEKLGLALSQKEIYNMLMGDNISPSIMQMQIFQNPQTGQFDKSALINFLQMIESDDLDSYPEEIAYQILEQKAQWLIAEKGIMKEHLNNKFVTLLSSSVLTNELDAKAAFENNKISVDFNYVAQTFSTIPDSEVEVTDSEIQKRYNETKTQYKQEEAKVINYIAVNVVPSQNDFNAAEAKLESLRGNLTTTTTANIAELLQFNSDLPFVDAFQSYTSLNTDLKNFVGSSTIGSIEGPIQNGNTFHLYKLIDEKTGADSIKVNLMPQIGRAHV